MLLTQYKVDLTTQYRVITHFSCICCVALAIMSRDVLCVIILCAKFKVEMVVNSRTVAVPESGRLQLFIDCQLKVKIFTFLRIKWEQMSDFIFLIPKRHYLGWNDV